MNDYVTSFNNLFLLSPEHQSSVVWGAYSIVNATLVGEYFYLYFFLIITLYNILIL